MPDVATGAVSALRCKARNRGGEMWIQWEFDGRPSKVHLADPHQPNVWTVCGLTISRHRLLEIEPVEGIDDLCRRCVGIEAKEKARGDETRAFPERGEN